MNLTNSFKSIKNYFLKDGIKVPDRPTIGGEENNSEIDLTGYEVAMSELSHMYNSSDFEKYNPDLLIGRKGHRIYQTMLLDEQIKAGIKFKKDAIISRGHYFNLSSDETGLPQSEVERRVKIFNTMVSKIEGSFSDSILKILTAIQFGYSLTEIIGGFFECDGLKYAGIKNLKLRPWHTFQFKTDPYGNVLDLIQTINGSKKSMDLGRFIHFVMNPDIDEHYGQSELRSCYRAWFSKDNIIKFRNIYLERFAGGFSTISPPEGKTLKQGTADYEAMSKIISNINVLTGIVLPESGYSIDLKFPTGGNANKAFSDGIDQSDMSMARSLLIPPLIGVSPQGDVGSYSQSETQLDAFFWTLITEANRLLECLNEQLFKPLGFINFGDEHYPRLCWKPGSLSKTMQIIKLFIELTSKKILKRTKEDEEFIRDSLELPAVKEFMSDEGESGAPSDGEDPHMEEEPSNNGGYEEDGNSEDETIIGKEVVEVLSAAFRKAQSRVNFAKIGIGAEGIVEDNVNRISYVTDKILVEFIEGAKSGGDLTQDLANNFKNIKVDTQLRQKLNSSISRVLKDSNKFGEKEAEKEIDKAMGESFSFRVNRERLKFIAEDYYKLRAFQITGNILDEMKKMIESEILNGARYDKTWQQVEEAIYTKAAKKGMISYDQAKDALAEALDVENPDHRLRTIVRTSTFEAINNARDSYFTDPQLGNFVRAYEYSAILDSRTTEICRHLDEENAGDHSIEWYNANSGFKPPNHYNCRSLLIAVTVNDLPEFTEGPTPSVQPMEGFS